MSTLLAADAKVTNEKKRKWPGVAEWGSNVLFLAISGMRAASGFKLNLLGLIDIAVLVIHSLII